MNVNTKAGTKYGDETIWSINQHRVGVQHLRKKLTCGYSEDWNQCVHPRSLIRDLVFQQKKRSAFCYPLSAHWRLWSDCADAQADLSPRWAHVPTCTLWWTLTQLNVCFITISNKTRCLSLRTLYWQFFHLPMVFRVRYGNWFIDSWSLPSSLHRLFDAASCRMHKHVDK